MATYCALYILSHSNIYVAMTIKYLAIYVSANKIIYIAIDNYLATCT